jgi:hypothetical protein
MATRYWVGGSGNWDATSTANWATSSGGASGASAPTSADDVIFDANSNVTTGAFTVTVTGTSSAPAVCNDFSTGGAGGALDGAMTLSMGATAQLDVFGSMTLPAANLTVSATSGSELKFAATTTGKTVTTNGVALTTLVINFAGNGGAWTLGSALTATNIRIREGTFDTGNYNITTGLFNDGSATTTKSVILGSSTITASSASAISFAGPNITFNAGTSQITCSATAPTFAGGGLTYYNVSFTSTAVGTVSISGTNTFNNLTFTSLAATGLKNIQISANQTVSGTLTFGAANTAIRRMAVFNGTSPPVAAITITLNGTLATLADVDFRGIATAGTVGTWTGTRLGDGQNNSGITFTAAANKYWNLAAGGSWSSTAWALSSGGAVDVNNFPLSQDTVIIENTGLNTSATITVDQSWWMGNVDCSTRSNAYTLSWGNSDPVIYGNFTLSSVATVTSTSSPSLTFFNYNSTKTINTAGVTFPVNFGVASYLGTVQLLNNLNISTFTFTLTTGTLDLNNNTLTCNLFSSSNANTRAIAFGTGKIVVTGNAGTVWSMTTATNFTYTGTPTVEANYSGSTGTRAIVHGSTAGGVESNAISVNITAGTDIVALDSAGTAGQSAIKNLNFTGFTGTAPQTYGATIYGNVTLGTGMTFGTGNLNLSATSGTQVYTTNGVTSIGTFTINAPGAIVQLADNFTMASDKTLTLTAGTLDVNSKTLTTGAFSSSNSNTRTVAMGTNGKITVNGGGWTATTSTGLSLTGTGTIDMTLGTAKTFAGGGVTYPYTLNQGGAGTLTITGANQFANISNTTQPATITFPSSTTTSVQNFTVSGTSGNLVTLNSSTPGTQFTLAKV